MRAGARACPFDMWILLFHDYCVVGQYLLLLFYMEPNIKQLLRQIVGDWQNGVLPRICDRETDLADYFDPKFKKIIAVTGFRRVGKTFSLFNFAKKYGKENCVYFNCEDERLPKETYVLTQLAEVLPELYGDKPLVLLVDEIQEIPDWSRWARRINESGDYRLVLSGSSSKLSSAEIPTELRGRTLNVRMFPLNWREYLKFKNEDFFKLAPEKRFFMLRDFLFFGGLPEIVLAQEGLRPMLLDDYYQTFVQRDIIGREKIRNKNALRDLLKLALNSRFFTYSKFAGNLKSMGHKIGKATVIDYLRAAQNAYFVSILETGSPSVKKRSQSAKKIYPVDTFFSHRYGAAFSQNLGHLMEQAVYLELLRKKSKDGLLEIFFWKDYRGREVDFMLAKNGRVEKLCQTTFAENLADLAPRETESLFLAGQKFPGADLAVITWDLETQLQKNGQTIKFIPLWKFLHDQQ